MFFGRREPSIVIPLVEYPGFIRGLEGLDLDRDHETFGYQACHEAFCAKCGTPFFKAAVVNRALCYRVFSDCSPAMDRCPKCGHAETRIVKHTERSKAEKIVLELQRLYSQR